MKAHFYDLNGTSKGEKNLPALFSTPIRKDLVNKAIEVLREFQLHYLDPRAGRKHSAAGTISHKRHDWKGHYGKGMSRIPRKIMWRRGIQFNWVGAEVSGTRGGRRIHGPKDTRHVKRMNAKEMQLALYSALAATAHTSYIKSRYERLATQDIPAPIVINLAHSPKAKEWALFIEKVFGKAADVVTQTHDVRAGKGKRRGRKYKTSAGALVIHSSKESFKLKGVESVSANEVSVSHLYPLGRIVIYTEKALEELQ